MLGFIAEHIDLFTVAILSMMLGAILTVRRH